MFNLLNKIKRNIKNLFFLKNSRGFTLIESMVAISILLIAMTGPLVLAKQGLKSSRLAKNQIIAFYLAQDAIEHIRSVRDSNFLSSSAWLTGLGNCIGGYCQVDTTTSVISSCVANCPLLRKSTTDGLYGYNAGWGETGFRRKVQIYQRLGTNSDEVYVEVKILWDNDSKSFTARESLFDLN